MFAYAGKSLIIVSTKVSIGIPKIKDISNILKSYHTIDKIKEIIESEKVDNNSEPYRLLANAVFEIEPIYIENIKSENRTTILSISISGIKGIVIVFFL